MLTSIKKIIPNFILRLLRNLRSKLFAFTDSSKPYLNNIKYCNFRLFYTRSEGLIERIRFGSPDRIYERSLCEKLYNELKKFDKPVFFDIGANIGLISIYLLNKISEVKVYAFEPGSRQAKLLGITIFANQLEQRMSLCTDAVGSENGVKTFFEHTGDSESSGDGFLDTKRGGETREVNKNVVTLDGWWAKNGFPLVNVIKIDIEGAELEALKGAKEIISKCSPVIYLEISELNLKVYPYTYQDVYKFFQANNYELCTIDGISVTDENFDSLISKEDTYIARPIK